MLSYRRETALQGALVLAKSGRLEDWKKKKKDSRFLRRYWLIALIIITSYFCLFVCMFVCLSLCLFVNNFK